MTPFGGLQKWMVFISGKFPLPGMDDYKFLGQPYDSGKLHRTMHNVPKIIKTPRLGEGTKHDQFSARQRSSWHNALGRFYFLQRYGNNMEETVSFDYV